MPSPLTQPRCACRTVHPTSRYLLAPALSLLASLYAATQATQNFLYRQGLLWQTSLPSPVVSIGNLTNGGTGKTPFVEYLARSYLESHKCEGGVIILCAAGRAGRAGRRERPQDAWRPLPAPPLVSHQLHGSQGGGRKAD